MKKAGNSPLFLDICPQNDYNEREYNVRREEKRGKSQMAVIRKAKGSDAAAFLRYDTHIAPEVLRRRIRDGFCFVAEEDSASVGVLRFGLLFEEHPFLELLYIDAAYRGRGIGRLCLSEWEREMRARSYRYVMTSTQADETAWRFYEKLGYERCGGFFPPEQAAEEWVFRKKL